MVFDLLVFGFLILGFDFWFGGKLLETSAKREKGTGLASYTADTKTVVAIVIVRWINVVATEVQVVGVVTAIDRTTPVVAVVARVVQA